MILAFLAVAGILYSINKSGGLSNLILSSTYTFDSGRFIQDGKFFAYTYHGEVEMPDVDGSVTIRGFSYPGYFQIIETSSGEKIHHTAYSTKKGERIFIADHNDSLIWMVQSKNNQYIQLLAYEIAAKKFRFQAGDLQKINTDIQWSSYLKLYQTTSSSEYGIILEADDNRLYYIDPITGKATLATGKYQSIDYLSNQNIQTTSTSQQIPYKTKEINGHRQSIISPNGNTISNDDFISAQFILNPLTELDMYDKRTLMKYNHHFFVISPIATHNPIDMELAMIDEQTLKTQWKIQLPQLRLKTIIPNYNHELFQIRADTLRATNNNFIITLDLSSGKILQQESLYE